MVFMVSHQWGFICFPMHRHLESNYKSAVDTEKTFLDKIIGNYVYSALLTWHADRQYHIYTKFLEIRKLSQKAYSNWKQSTNKEISSLAFLTASDQSSVRGITKTQ